MRPTGERGCGTLLGVRVLLALLMGCSASGGASDLPNVDASKNDVTVDTATAEEVAVDTAMEMIDTAAETAPGDAIFPVEDTSIGDVGGCADCVDVPVNVPDCGSVSCPAEYPNVVGCSITMGGTDSRGCVAHASGSPTVSFQVGSACSGTADGFVTGVVRCSKTPGAALNAKSCPISKPTKLYVSSLSACP